MAAAWYTMITTIFNQDNNHHHHNCATSPVISNLLLTETLPNMPANHHFCCILLHMPVKYFSMLLLQHLLWRHLHNILHRIPHHYPHWLHCLWKKINIFIMISGWEEWRGANKCQVSHCCSSETRVSSLMRTSANIYLDTTTTPCDSIMIPVCFQYTNNTKPTQCLKIYFKMTYSCALDCICCGGKGCCMPRPLVKCRLHCGTVSIWLLTVHSNLSDKSKK